MTRSRLTDSELAALAARIQRNYDYDDRSGKLVNRKTDRVVKGNKYARRNGVCRYVYIDLYSFGKRYRFLMHRAIWAWHNGCFPTLQIDHINGNGFDNHIGNLREVSGSENKKNTHYPWKPNADTGLPGVYKHGNGYQIKVGQHHYYFRDPFVAFYHLTLLGRRFKLEVRGNLSPLEN